MLFDGSRWRADGEIVVIEPDGTVRGSRVLEEDWTLELRVPADQAQTVEAAPLDPLAGDRLRAR